MARLNDPPMTAESIDGLKRRFIRQNRELARVNSTQSLRIRNLEAEISRLLTENIALREQAINVAQEAERWRNSYDAAAVIAKLKLNLEAKLHEVGSLVNELGTLSDRTSRWPASRRMSRLQRAVKSPDQKEWKNRQSIVGVICADREAQEGRLPAILEDKHYPRKSWEPVEVQKLMEQAEHTTESPDLGPPPIAHFEVPEPIDFCTTSTARPNVNEREIEHENALALSENLETRRRRRTSALLQDMTAKASATVEEEMPAISQTKTGAKRKLDARELEGNAESSASKAEVFVFHRELDTDRTTTTNRKASRFTRQPSKTTDHVTSPQKQEDLVRQALAPKSTNSPTKSGAFAEEKSQDPKIQVHKTARHQIGGQSSGLKTKAEKQDTSDDCMVLRHHVSDKEMELPPRIPAALKFLSPVCTEPSSKGQQPQKMTIINSVEDVLNGSIGRGSRRVRPAVSYAEPNLRDKMRRPSKELVGAIEGLDKTRDREASGRSESVDQGRNEGTGVIKREENGSASTLRNLPRAQDEAPSPLQDKSSRSPEDNNGTKQQHNKKSRRELQDIVSRLSIYDPPVSSPTDKSSAFGPDEVLTTKERSVKTRRHSTIPGNLTRSASDAALRTSTKIPPPRPLSAAGHRSRTSSSDLADLKPPNSSASVHSDQQQASSGHAERMSARRRSMVV